jgi:hypothetical protein
LSGPRGIGSLAALIMFGEAAARTGWVEVDFSGVWPLLFQADRNELADVTSFADIKAGCSGTRL